MFPAGLDRPGIAQPQHLIARQRQSILGVSHQPFQRHLKGSDLSGSTHCCGIRNPKASCSVDGLGATASPDPQKGCRARRDLSVWSRVTPSTSLNRPRSAAPFRAPGRSRCALTVGAPWCEVSSRRPLWATRPWREGAGEVAADLERRVCLTRQSLELCINLWIIVLRRRFIRFRKSGVNPHAAPPAGPARSPSPGRGRCISTPPLPVMASVTRASGASWPAGAASRCALGSAPI